MQKQETGEVKPVAYVSRYMTTTERRYAQIKKEALAFTWACERLSDYLTGLKFRIETDHKPLVPLFSTKNLEKLALRVQCFQLRMMRFSFTITHVPGKELVIADTLSRTPAGNTTQEENLLQEETRAYVNRILESIPSTEQRLEEIRRHQESNEIRQSITEFCKSGWPKEKQLFAETKEYLPMAAKFTVENNVLLRGNRIVIPPPLQQNILSHIHEGYQGITKCRERARNSIWWPGISRDIEHLVSSCEICTKAQIQRAQPLIPSALPELPWQQVATDLFQWKDQICRLLLSLNRDHQTGPDNNGRGYPEDEKYIRNIRHTTGGSLGQWSTVIQPSIRGIRKGLPVLPRN